MSSWRKFAFILMRVPGDQKRLAVLLALLTLAAGLEVLGIGLVMPFVALIQRPAIARESRVMSAVMSAAHVHTPTGTIIAAGLLLLAVFVFKNVYLLVVSHLQVRFSINRMSLFSQHLLESYLSRPYTFFLTRNSTELVRNVVMDAHALFAVPIPSFFVVIVEGLTCFVVAVLLVFLEPIAVPLAALFIGSGAYALQSIYRRQSSSFGARVRVQEEEMMKLASQGFGGIKEARVIGCESYFADTFRKSNHSLNRMMLVHRTLLFVPRYSLETLGVMGLVVITVVVLLRGGTTERLVPLLGVLALAVVRLMPSVTRILSALSEIRYYVPTAESAGRDLSAPKEFPLLRVDERMSPMSFDKDIRLNEVDYRYLGSTEPALQNICLSIRKGEVIALIGSSGAGKTTLADVLIGVIPPTSGTIEIDGRPINSIELLRSWQRNIGYIPQTVYVSDDTLRRNVAFGIKDELIDEQKLQRALKSAQLDALIASLPDGLNTTVGERGVRLSGGQRQRIGIARALYLEPKVLVLDEATSALDGLTESEVVEAIEAARTDRTTIVIAHRLSTVRSCDRLVYMSAGRVEHVGSWDEVLTASAEFRRLVEIGGHAVSEAWTRQTRVER